MPVMTNVLPRQLPAICLTLACLCVLQACAMGEREDAAADGHAYLPMRELDMNDVMQAKLLHTQAIVEGMALGNMRQVEVNAEALHELSLRSSWMAHDTVTYVAMSDTFRDNVMTMWQHAEADHPDAVMDSYLAMAKTCLDCHTYLREERRFLDAPGRRSMILDALEYELW